MRKHSVDLSSTNAQGTALGSCEELWFLQAVVARMGSAPLTVGDFMSGVNALGYSFASPSAYGVHLSASQHDGIAALRNMRFLDSCTCYRYSTKPYRA